MVTNAKRTEAAEQAQPTARWYDIPYPASAYTFPQETLVHDVRFDNDYVHLELTDGRILSLPLWWIPTLHNAEPEEREKYEISRDRKMIVWDPEKCSINDEIWIEDYLIPRSSKGIATALMAPPKSAAESTRAKSPVRRKQNKRLSRLTKRPTKQLPPTPRTARRG